MLSRMTFQSCTYQVTAARLSDFLVDQLIKTEHVKQIITDTLNTSSPTLYCCNDPSPFLLQFVCNLHKGSVLTAFYVFPYGIFPLSELRFLYDV